MDIHTVGNHKNKDTKVIQLYTFENFKSSHTTAHCIKEQPLNPFLFWI